MTVSEIEQQRLAAAKVVQDTVVEVRKIILLRASELYNDDTESGAKSRWLLMGRIISYLFANFYQIGIKVSEEVTLKKETNNDLAR
jgi:hypothetical protein